MNPIPPVIDSPAAFAAAVNWGFEQAIAMSSRWILICDRDFAEWSLDDAVAGDRLNAWLRLPGRRLRLLAGTYDEVPRRWPRFNEWRRWRVHAVEAWQAPAEMQADLPTLLLADSGVSVRLFDARQGRGRADIDRRNALALHEQVDAILQRSERAFPANALGL